MPKYKINKEFFPFSCFTPPISEKFLAMAVPHMKTPKFIYKDKDVVVKKHEIKSFDNENIDNGIITDTSEQEQRSNDDETLIENA